MINFKSEFFTRFFSGTLYIIIVLLCNNLGFFYFKILMLLFSLLCLREFFIITAIGSKLSNFLLAIFIIGMIFHSLFTEGNIIENAIYFLIFFSPLPILFELFSPIPAKEKLRRIACVFFSFIYIYIPFILACELYLLKGKQMFLGLFLLIWINDTFAYMIGTSRWGKHKLAILISPAKTLEGFFGGLVLCMIISVVFYLFSLQRYWPIIGLITGIFGTIGDLVESLIKRTCRVKNSGNLLPGHGGFLDRHDSFIFVIYATMIYVILFN